MKLTYWVAEAERDADCYNVRARTRREAITILAETYRPEDYGPIHKVTVEYDDGFDLLWQCLSEGRVYEG